MSLVREALRALDVEPRERSVALAVTRAAAYLREHLDVEVAAAERRERATAAALPRRTPPPATYPVREVRAWARERGLAVPDRGSHLPADVVAAWRADNGTTSTHGGEA